MPTKITKALRDYSDAELRALASDVETEQDRIEITEPTKRGLQKPEFWSLQEER